MEQERSSAHHVLAVPYPSQGHINPLLQLCKHLVFTKGLKTTFAITNFISKSFTPNLAAEVPVQFDTISDGYDQAGFAEANSIHDYLTRFELIGSRTLADLIQRHSRTEHPITCIVYEAFLPWVFDVAKQHGVAAAVFFTQPCMVNYIYFCLKKGLVSLEDVSSGQAEVPSLTPAMKVEEMASFIRFPESYPAYREMVLNQYLNVDKADWILVNTIYELENEIIDTMSTVTGPTIPSFYLDNRIKGDKNYGLYLFHVQDSASNAIAEWMKSKPARSVVYLTFGSVASMEEEQMEEISWVLRDSGYNILLAVRATEVPKLPKDFAEEVDSKSERYLLANWCTQLEVLSSEAIGCFLSHCSWNSALEALCLGVPIVAMPQWTDQPTNAKLVEDVWKVGLRAKADSKGVVRREELQACIREVMEGERGDMMRANAHAWRDSAKKSLSPGGSSYNNIDAFILKTCGC